MQKSESFRETFIQHADLEEKVKAAQEKTGIVSKSEMYRQLIRAGLEKIMSA
jgi:hypothetical protein